MKKAFTLVELLIVIMILGVVYSLSITSLNRLSSNALDTKKTLWEELQALKQRFTYQHTLRIVCIDKCGRCFVEIDNTKRQTIKPFIKQKLQAFRYDPFNGMEPMEYESFFDQSGIEHDVCFSYRFIKGEVGEMFYVVKDQKVYKLGSVFGQDLFYSLDAAGRYEQELLQKVLN